MIPLSIDKNSRTVQKTIGNYELQISLQQDKLIIYNQSKITSRRFQSILTDSNLNANLKKHFRSIKGLFDVIQNQIYNPENIVLSQNECQIYLNKSVKQENKQIPNIVLQAHQISNEMDHLVDRFQRVRKHFQNSLNKSVPKISFKKIGNQIQILKQSKSQDNSKIKQSPNKEQLKKKIKLLEYDRAKNQQILKNTILQNNSLKLNIINLTKKIQSLQIKENSLIQENQRLKTNLEIYQSKSKMQNLIEGKSIRDSKPTQLFPVKQNKSYKHLRTFSYKSQSPKQKNKIIFKGTNPIKSLQITCKWGKMPPQFKYDKNTQVVQMINAKGYWYQLIGDEPLPSAGHYNYKIKIVNSLTMFIMIGIVTENAKQQQYSWNNTESIKYYLYNGSIFINGKSLQRRSDSINEKHIITVQIDTKNQSICWYKDDKQLTIVKIDDKMIKKKIYLSIDMLMNGDQIKLLNREND